jgi:hypothetical protein
MDKQEQEYLLTMRGVMAITIHSLNDTDCNKRKVESMAFKFCKVMALNRYGKSANEILNEMRLLTPDTIPVWVDKIWDVFYY